jgi:tripartite-type tricarboxylate transporter receptor subunit TctC
LGPSLICVGPHVQASTLAELVALAKSKPGELTYASAGIGSGLHLSAELFKKLAGIDIKHVPYKGAALATGDLLGGRVDMIVDILSSVKPLVDDNKLKALAITSKERSALYPQVPPAAETVPGYEFIAWFGLYLPANAQAGLAEQLQARRRRFSLRPMSSRAMACSGWRRSGRPQPSSPGSWLPTSTNGGEP